MAGVVAVFWKLVLTSQYSFLEHYDDANQVLPWLQVQVFAIRHWSLVLWDPYEWAGQSLVGQLQPGVFSPFTWLLALAPLDREGHIQIYAVHIWFVFLHVTAAWFAYFLFRDLGCRKPAATIGALFYGTAGFLGNTPWPQMVESALWGPLVFLFLLRSMRGRAPLKNAALAGFALGLAWCGGHHGPALTLSLAVGAVCVYYCITNRSQTIPRSAVLLLICVLVGAVQILPSLEYGNRAVRWTATGVKQWNDEIPYTEHDEFSLAPQNLLHILVPGGNGMMGDPFTGVVALSLAVLAVWTDCRRREVRIFLALAAGAVLYSMARSDFLYGVLYSLVPFVRKAREPILALSVFEFGMAGLVAFGADRLHEFPTQFSLPAIKRALVWFGVGVFGFFYLMAFLRPTVTSAIVDTDPRIGMIALIALLLAAALHAKRPSIAAIGFLLLLEQGNETGSRWLHQSDKGAVLLAPLSKTQDLADFLRKQPGPFRVEMDRKDIAFNFGDWYRVDTVVEYTPSAPAETLRLNWWQDRMAQLYGIGYTIAKTPTRPGQQEVFTGSSGLKIFRNPQAFPRAWTVHQITAAPDEDRGADLVRDGNFDLKTTVVMAGEKPPVESCSAPDTLEPVSETPSRVSVSVNMACPGLAVVSDNWFPGWVATVDGKPARIWKVDTSFRGVAAGSGRHRIEMNYRPGSVYLGVACALAGLILTAFLVRRKEEAAPGRPPPQNRRRPRVPLGKHNNGVAMKRLFQTCRAQLFLIAAVCAVYWKILLSGQYSVLEHPDMANLDLPWMELQVHALQSGTIALWSPYEWFGHTIIGQLAFVLCSPLSYLLALGPLDSNGHIQMWFVQIWIVLIHCAVALFAFWLCRDLGCSRAAALAGGLLYATSSGIGNTGWPQFVLVAMWGPLLFLFLMRSLRGRAPLKNAAWAGVALGLAWLGGHHAPAIYLTLASFGAGLTFLIRRPGARFRGGCRLAVMFVVFVSVASVQALPAAESGQLSLRWVSSGPTAWNDTVPFPEHGLFAFSVPDMLHLVVPGGTALYWDPFIGVVGLSLAAIAVLCAFRRIEVRVFAMLGLSAFLFALAKNDVFYGLFYALVPLVEKAREPMVALSVFGISVAVLAAFGVDQLLAGGARKVLPQVGAVLVSFAILTFSLFLLTRFLQPAVTSTIAQGDPRVGMIALIALGAAGILLAWNRGVLGRTGVVVLLCASMMIEQGVESDWNYAHKDDKGRAAFLKPLFDNQDVADFLRSRPDPKRAELNNKDISFNFGNWYGIDAPEEYTNGMLADTYRLGWNSDRLSRMYGENYTVSKVSTRGGQQDLFTGASGLKVFANPAAFPRAWTVHELRTAPDEDRAAALVRDGPFDLRSTAVMTGKPPSLEKCGGEDRVNGFREDLSSVHVGVTMACTGLVIVSDSYYPGWRAQVDGKSAKLWKVNTVIRGVVVPPGGHEIVMNYRPLSVYAGFVLMLCGFTIAIVLQRRREPDCIDLLSNSTSLSSL